MFFLSHLIYSFSVIYGNTQSLFYELFYELILNPKLESIITAKILICFCLGKIFSEKKPDICVDARFLWVWVRCG